MHPLRFILRLKLLALPLWIEVFFTLCILSFKHSLTKAENAEEAKTNRVYTRFKVYIHFTVNVF